MPKPAAKPLTQRERQCRQVARDKARHKRMHALMVKLRIAAVAAGVAIILAGGAWEYFGHGISRTAQAAADAVYAATGRAGFTVQAMYLEGRSRTKLAEAQAAIGVKAGEPILGISLDEMRKRLETLPTVKRAEVERALPGTLTIRLTEREPVALWQHGGKLSLIDDEGTVMDDLALADYSDLPLVVGAGAAPRVSEALALWEAEGELKPRILAMTRMGDRRWNIRLKNGADVKLPEENPAAAWAKLAKLEHEQKLLERGLRSVDMREPDKLVLRLPPAPQPAIAGAAGAKET